MDQIVAITDFRRNAGAYIDQSVPLIIVRDSQVVGSYVPTAKKIIKMTTKEKLEKLKQLTGGFHFGKGLTADQMNHEYDKMYDEMLPR